MTTYYVDSGAGAVEYANKAWTVGNLMVPAVADASANHLITKQWIWECTTAGTSTATPTWPASVTDGVTTVTQNGVVWTARAPTSWAYAMPGIYWLAADSTTERLVSGDVVLVASTHSCVYAAYGILKFPGALTNQAPVNIISVNKTTGVPEAGALESSATGNTGFSTIGPAFVFGMQFRNGTTSSSGFFIAGRPAGGQDMVSRYLQCTFINRTGGVTQIGSSDYTNSGASEVWFESCIFNETIGNTITFLQEGLFNFLCCNWTGSITTIFGVFNDTMTARFAGCDFSAATNLVNISANGTNNLFFANCKTPANLTTGTHAGIGATKIEMHACANADHVYDYYFQDGSGVIQESTTIYRTSSPAQVTDTDGSLVSYSLECNPSTNASAAFPLCSPWFSAFNATTGSKTVSLDIAYDAATALKDCECWIEVEYYGDALTPKSTIEVSAPVVSGTLSRDILAAGTALTDTTAAWTGTAGWANKKTATLSKTVTINQQGYVRARLCLAKDVTVYVDPTIGIA